MTSGEVGSEIDAWCTSCKRELNHVVVARVEDQVKRVQCLTCGGQHNYRPTAPATGRAPASKPRRPSTRAKPTGLPPEDPNAPARPYQTSDGYRPGELVQHPVFGRGRVIAVRGAKVDIQFPPGVRTLLHTPPGEPAPSRPVPGLS